MVTCFFRNITHFTFDMGNGYVKSLVMPHPASLFLDTLYDPEAIIKTNGKQHVRYWHVVPLCKTQMDVRAP